MSPRTILVSVVALAALVIGCGGEDGTDATTATTTATTPTQETVPTTITLLTHDSFLLSETTLASFTEQTGITVELLAGGDAGAMLNQAILTRDNPIADVLFGVDNTFLTRALGEDLFVPYESPALDRVDDGLELDPDHRVTPVDYGDVCVNYDKAALAAAGVEPPETLDDLVDPRYRGMLVVEDPATSSPGLAFLLGTVSAYGDGNGGWRTFWEELSANDVLVTAGWEEAYNGAFSGASDTGDRPLVVSYASSPPAEVFFAETPPEEAPTGSMTAGCFRQIEFAGILRGTDHEAEAGQLIDFMLSDTFQEDIPLNMFVFPVVDGVALPEVFVEHAAPVDEPLTLPPDEIDANRERWIQEWTDLLR
ncbi:MAG: thiamine ABC transporter substrate-binding protein [Acidimicrobiia bacterium]|nr:thiamine ABC transporter substrate-binding protein [Acidimicrobiia bacterium]